MNKTKQKQKDTVWLIHLNHVIARATLFWIHILKRSKHKEKYINYAFPIQLQIKFELINYKFTV